MIVWITSSAEAATRFPVLSFINFWGAYRRRFLCEWGAPGRGADDLVGCKKLPHRLATAVASGRHEQIQVTLKELDTSEELFHQKTHAKANELFGTNYRAILSLVKVETRWTRTPTICSTFDIMQEHCGLHRVGFQARSAAGTLALRRP